MFRVLAVLWSRGNWRLVRVEDNRRTYNILENRKTCAVDYPVLETRCSLPAVCYDYPERVPAYVQKAVARIVTLGG